MRLLKCWTVRFGSSCHRFYTDYHRDQFTRALTLNGTPWESSEGFEVIR